MKKKWIAGIAGLLAIAAVGVTLAYFTATKTATNTFTIGTNTISVEEEFDESSISLAVGLNSYKKNVTIKNTGTTDAFIRVYAAFSDSDVAESSFIAAKTPSAVSGISPGEALSDVTAAMTAAGYKTYSDFWTSGGPSNDWVYIPSTVSGDDALLGGYFYYTKPVSPKDSTAALMDTVATYFASSDDVQAYDIIIYAESVQTADKDGTTFTGNDAYKRAWKEFLDRK